MDPIEEVILWLIKIETPQVGVNILNRYSSVKAPG